MFPKHVPGRLLLLTVLLACGDGGGGAGGGITEPTPAISVTPGATAMSIAQGESGTMTVTVARTGGFTGAVDLSLEGAPAGLTAAFAPASVTAASTSSTLSLAAATTTAAGAHSVTLRARGQGVQDRTATLAITVTVPPTISATLTPDTLRVAQGASAEAVFRIARTNFTDAVALSVSGAPAGVTATIAPVSITADSALVTIGVGAEASPGDYTLNVTAEAPGIENLTTPLAITVTVPPSISATLTPDTLRVAQGASAEAVFRIARTNFTDAVALSVSGAPAGVTATIAPVSITADSALVTIGVGGAVATGSHTLSVIAQAPGIENLTTALQLTVEEMPRFGLSVLPASVSAEQGESVTAEVTITRTNFPGSVDLSLEGAPAGVTGAFDPASLAAGSATSTLTLAVAAGAAPGSVALTISGVGEGVAEQTVELPLTITAAPTGDFSLSLSPTSVTLPQGGSETTTATIARTGGFAGSVALSVGGMPAGMSAAFTPANVSGNTATLTLEATAGVVLGTYELTARGSALVAPGHTVRDSVSLSVTVEAPPGGDWAQTSAGSNHNCGLTTAGVGYCWGENASGQLGNGNQTDQTRPTLVAGGHVWQAISAGTSYTCGITTGGVAYCWGYGLQGQLGNGGTSTAVLTPTPVSISGGDRWASISAAAYHTCALTTDGRAFCWGANNRGQLGSGNTTAQTTRVLVTGGHNWRSVYAGGLAFGGGTSCGVTTAGAAYCWGNNRYGQLGDGNPGAAANPIPVPVPGGTTWGSVIPGNAYTCGTTTADDAYCWGDNARGQLGNGNTIDQSVPTLVLNDHEWTIVVPASLGSYPTTCGITQTGAAYCWGSNAQGKVGNGNTSASQTSPALVLGGYAWSYLGSGDAHTCGMTTNGEAYCWGWGRSGQLGAGSTALSSTPLRVADPQ